MRILYSSDSYRDHQTRFIPPVERAVQFFRDSRRKRIERLLGKGRMGRILDVGCGRGVFLSAMKEHGWETFGLELNDETAWHAQNSLGLEVKTGRLADAKFDREFFDAVTIWHVLEHIPDPVAAIEESRRVLKPGGLLAIAIPNFGSLQARIAGRYWFHLDIPYHLYHFTSVNLIALLERHAFKVVKVKHSSLEFNPFGYLQSFLNMSGIENNFLYDILKSRTIRKSLLSAMGYFKFLANLIATLLLTPLFLPLSLLFSLGESMLGKGGTIEVYSVKELRPPRAGLREF
ncbi:MAG TPA: class I SAM-dependent methyltransferase [Dissulfurispiraceae bacterium]